MSDRRPILVTGAAGFIGFHTAMRLLDLGETVVGFDNLNPYYSVELKKARMSQLLDRAEMHMFEADLRDRTALDRVFSERRPRAVVNLGAQVGVRHSLTDPHSYVDSNVAGFLNLLEACRMHGVQHLVYASSSSVYGNNRRLPFSTSDSVDGPISIYAATKKANELMAHTYSHLYSLPTTGLRFFTVYGPWGRPDMAMFLFTKALFEGSPIRLFDGGRMRRDFTFVSDTVEGIVGALFRVPTPENVPSDHPADASLHYRVYNIGNHAPVEVGYLISVLERLTGRTAVIENLPMQPGEVPATFADVEPLTRDVGFQPQVTIEEGASRFVEWYRQYYEVS